MPPIFPRTIEKTGYVSEMTLEVNEARDKDNRVAFFRFTITDDIEGILNPVTFALSRDSQYASDNPANTWMGLPFSSVQVASVAALKDAYIHRKRVIAKGWHDSAGPGRDHNELTCLTLSERSGPYLLQVKPSITVDQMGRRLGKASAVVTKKVSRSPTRSSKSRTRR